MKKLIESVLERYKNRQLNLASSAARKLLAEEIEAVIVTEGVKTNRWKNCVLLVKKKPHIIEKTTLTKESGIYEELVSYVLIVMMNFMLNQNQE